MLSWLHAPRTQPPHTFLRMASCTPTSPQCERLKAVVFRKSGDPGQCPGCWHVSRATLMAPARGDVEASQKRCAQMRFKVQVRHTVVCMHCYRHNAATRPQLHARARCYPTSAPTQIPNPTVLFIAFAITLVHYQRPLNDVSLFWNHE
jgi:hypothetical protein